MKQHPAFAAVCLLVLAVCSVAASADEGAAQRHPDASDTYTITRDASVGAAIQSGGYD